MDNNTVIGIVVVFLIGFIGFLLNIYRQGKEQAKEFNALAITFNDGISKLNILVSQLNTTVEFLNKEIEKQSERNTIHGKEIDSIDKVVTVNRAMLEKLEDRMDILERKTCAGQK